MSGEELSGDGVARGGLNQQQIERDIRLGKCMAKPGAIRQYRHRERLTSMERFLKTITPFVPARFTSMMRKSDGSIRNEGCEPHFVLGDLWRTFKEWSSYGVGVPLILNGRDHLVQYYIPYLSAIQIYVDPSISSAISRQRSRENEGKYVAKDSVEQRETTDLSPKMENLSLKDQQTAAKEGFSGDDGEPVNSLGCLLFQYLEQDSPFIRIPLYCKISELALDFPELMHLRSCDMLSSSWVSIAWYPTYGLPSGAPALRDLEACFLTYHSLSTTPPLEDAGGVQEPIVIFPKAIDSVPKIPLPSFGLSTYKYRGSMWTSNSTRSQQMVNSLTEAASTWLTMLKVHHPDYNFFASRR